MIPRGHCYSIGHIHLVLSLVLSSATSMRGASRSLDIMFESMEMKLHAPSWYSVRLWLLRVGLYKLTRDKEISDDWIWIIDHTIQCGNEKCLAIFGIRQSALPEGDLNLCHEDVEPLALYPVTRSNAQVVYQQLEETASITGVPREIVADNGPDIKAGAKLFHNNNPQTCFVYDIKHKGASILKRHLCDDDHWKKFIKCASRTGKQLQQTDLASLTPPAQRSKARYMNVDRLIKWAYDTIVFMEHQNESDHPEFDVDILNEKLNWIYDFHTQIIQWQEIIDVVETAVDFIRVNGLYHNCHIDLENEPLFNAHAPVAQAIRNELFEFVKGESKKARPHEKLIGSSEVIESLFGKLKYLEKDQSKSGFTAMLLTLASSVAVTTKEVVRKTMESVPTKKVYQWFSDNIGQSVQSKRKIIKNIVRQEEQI